MKALRKPISGLFAALALALSGQVGAAALPAYPFVHTTGSAVRYGMPDIAALDLEVLAGDADPAIARGIVDTRVQEVRTLATQLGLEEDDISVREVRQSVRKGGEAGAPIYDVRCEVHLKIRNIANWRPLASGLIGKPNLDGLASTFDLLDMAPIEEGLIQEATAEARRHADMTAAGLGTRVTAVMGATPGQLKNLSTQMGLEPGEYRTGGPTGFTRTHEGNGGEVLAVPVLRWQQGVDVLFRIDAAGTKKTPGKPGVGTRK